MEVQYIISAVVNGKAMMLETPEALYKIKTADHLAEVYFRNVPGVETVNVYQVVANLDTPPTLTLITQWVNPVHAWG